MSKTHKIFTKNTTQNKKSMIKYLWYYLKLNKFNNRIIYLHKNNMKFLTQFCYNSFGK